ncbi:peptidylprolyl isomerase [Neosynechococcus sphagnicola]|uniref:peptidylprolyl isomerase n=1 Tax=Neosynechococcus sphagnicola TaxID=1501145 RepID=UPI003084177F
MILVLLTGGCSFPQANSAASSPSAASASPLSTPESSAANNPATPSSVATNPQMTNLPRLDGKATVVMVVKGSPITIEVDGSDAPITAGNFVDLVNRGVYDGLVFHRVVRQPQPFVVHGGGSPGQRPKIFP